MHLIDFKILNTAIERLLNKELSEFGITYTQATVIGYLKRNIDKEICQRDIEYNLGLTTPTVCSILSRMEEKQMILTHPSKADRRYKSISLTPQAVEMAEDISVKIDNITAKLFFGISEDDKNITGATIQKIIKNID